MLLSSGFARITLNPEDGVTLTTVLRECRTFFARSTARKQQHASADGNSGYRAMGQEYSASPDRPDVNEVFSLWSDRIDLIPEPDGLGALAVALVDWRGVMVRVDAHDFFGDFEIAPHPRRQKNSIRAKFARRSRRHHRSR